MNAADALGAALAKQPAGAGRDVISAQVVDVTSEGVNLSIGGTLVPDVPCPDSYSGRKAGDWVAVRIAGGKPVVMWRLGTDPATDANSQARQVATDAALSVQVVRATTWGTGAPAGSGWQQATTPWCRLIDGKVELYFQLAGSPSSPPPPVPPVPPPAPVVITPTAHGSWRNGRPDGYHADPSQGDWTGRGNLRGAWFYGTAIAAACAGRTVASMGLSVTRIRGSGSDSKRPMHAYLHNYTSPPSGDLSLGAGPMDLLSLSTGGQAVASLPGDWVAALAAGTARGIAVYALGSTDYAAWTDGRITITYA